MARPRQKQRKKQAQASSRVRKDRLGTASAWLGANRRAVILTIVAVSVLLRIIYFVEINASPLLWQHRWDKSDMNHFDQWARDIAKGDWLTRRPTVPMHSWQKQIAADYLEEHPDRAEALTKEAAAMSPPGEPANLLWVKWAGGLTFYQEPLYAYLMAVTYKIFGGDHRWVFLWQLVLGVLTNVLIYLLARRMFGDLVGTVAGALAVLCSPMMFYELILLRESLIVFTGFLLLSLVTRAGDRDTLLWWLFTGVAFGVAFTLKSTFAPLAIGLMALTAYNLRGRRESLIRSLAGMTGGLVIGLLPLVTRNLLVSLPPITTAGSAVTTFIQTNAAGYPFYLRGFVLNAEDIIRIMGETDGKFLPTVFKTLGTHSGIGSILVMLFSKFFSMWHWVELPNNENFYSTKLYAPVLGLMPVTFFTLSPLALIGLVLARKYRAASPLYVLVVSSMIPMLLYLVISRLRLPLLAAVIPFAALALVETARVLLKGEWGRAAALIGAASALAFVLFRPLPTGLQIIRPTDYVVPYIVMYGPEEEAAWAKGDHRRVAEIIREVLRREPEEYREGTLPPGTYPDPTLIHFYTGLHYRLFQALKETGDTAGAADQETITKRLLRYAP